jgi:hypothetical protein
MSVGNSMLQPVHSPCSSPQAPQLRLSMSFLQGCFVECQCPAPAGWQRGEWPSPGVTSCVPPQPWTDDRIWSRTWTHQISAVLPYLHQLICSHHLYALIRFHFHKFNSALLPHSFHQCLLSLMTSHVPCISLQNSSWRPSTCLLMVPSNSVWADYIAFMVTSISPCPAFTAALISSQLAFVSALICSWPALIVVHKSSWPFSAFLWMAFKATLSSSWLASTFSQP